MYGATTTSCIVVGIRIREFIQGYGKMTTSTKMATKQTESGTRIGYETEMLAMADTLRGSMDPAEYRHTVLGGHVRGFGGGP